MIGYHDASSALTLLVLLTGASFLHRSTPNPINTPGDVNNPHKDTPPGLTVSGDRQRKDEERRLIQKEEAEKEEELFKDVDPKTLAAVLLEALNRSQVERGREGEERDGIEEKLWLNAEMGEVKKEESYRDVKTMKEADRVRDGRQELDLLMAAQETAQEREEEEERKKAQEEEEKMTEKVTSHTTSQTVQVQTEQQLVSPDGRGENGQPQQGPNSPEQGSNEEEQLSPEELKNLEAMMKEFPRLNTAERERDSEQNQRESRGYSSYNDIIPINKGGDLTMSKKKLKWQEETQKALNFPIFRGGNFMDDFEDSNYAGSNAAQSQLPAEQKVMEDNEPEEEEEDEEMLSPEEEEAQAKAEQEEMRRQAAEAQRAKMEEEKLADIASDMLLRYMVKQNNGNKKYSSFLSNAAEDKRSDEEQEVTEEDDIDPQTIDKLIEISSKLHLPADDVVDIISDVEKKKKKDVPPEMTSRWQKPLTPMSSSFSSTSGFSASPISTNQNSFPVSKQPSSVVNLLKTWFQEKSPTKSQDFWSKPAKLLLTNQNLWPTPQKPLSVKQELWLKSPKSVWAGYPLYTYTYPSYYQRKPYPDYYPIYFPPPHRPKPRYYVPKPNFLGNSAYPLPLHPWTFQPIPIPKPRSPPRMPVIYPQQKQFYYSAPAPAVTRNEDYYVAGKQPHSSNRDDLEKYIQQILMKRLQILD
ncbi:neurosecretory protein VGF [Siniperca chuatsi]|uniref:neurosecretory protein VGF n=1 Tax=Siniperca chuatsi TaxID=119488 RepID=UPI001CE0AD16|nr:neurosecretory protein VGF [Siniperca chuatsi]XP_044040769.1 neurosecretory protein VGF [Siniperca chuatsi]